MDKQAGQAQVIDLAQWRRKKLELQSQEDYIRKLCTRCGGGPTRCGESDLRRLTEIQRQLILDLMRSPDAPAGKGDKEPEG